MSTSANRFNQPHPKVFAFFGEDLQHEAQNYLAENVASGYALLALDAPAIGAAAMAGLRYTLIGDWIDTDARRRARELAVRCYHNWFESARDAFTIDQVCWPEFDRFAMLWFWHEVFVAEALAQSFREHRLAALKFFQHEPNRPCLQHHPADIVRAVWQGSLPDRCEVLTKAKSASPLIVAPKPLWRRAVRYSKRQMKSAIGLLRPAIGEDGKEIVSIMLRISPDPLRELKNSVILVCYDHEFFRFETIIRKLVEVFPGRIAGMTALPNLSTAKEIGEKLHFPVIRGPYGPSEPGLSDLFTAGYQQLLRESVPAPWDAALRQLHFHFEYYCVERWPRLVTNYRRWCDFWDRTEPAAVIVSAMPDAESQIPAAAARTIDLATYAIPHGAVEWDDNNQMSGERVLCDDLLQKEVWRKTGIPVERLQLCRGIVQENEYRVKTVSFKAAVGKCRIVALSEAISFNGRILPGSHKAQLEALTILCDPPDTVRDEIEVAIKLHPSFPEMELCSALGTGVSDKVLPVDSNLITLLPDIDLVVSINYLGSALIHVIRAEKPIVFLWTDPLLGQILGQAYSEFFREAGVVARTPSEFWKLVSEFVDNKELASQMRACVRKFAKQYLDNSSYPTIDEVVGRQLKDPQTLRNRYRRLKFPRFVASE